MQHSIELRWIFPVSAPLTSWQCFSNPTHNMTCVRCWEVVEIRLKQSSAFLWKHDIVYSKFLYTLKFQTCIFFTAIFGNTFLAVFSWVVFFFFATYGTTLFTFSINKYDWARAALRQSFKSACVTSSNGLAGSVTSMEIAHNCRSYFCIKWGM